MDLIFGKIFFHRHRIENEFVESEQERMLTEVEAVLDKYGVELARYEVAGLLGKSNPTGKCSRCGYLTLDVDRSTEELEKGDVYDDLNEVIHLGHTLEGKLICSECEKWLKNT